MKKVTISTIGFFCLVLGASAARAQLEPQPAPEGTPPAQDPSAPPVETYGQTPPQPQPQPAYQPQPQPQPAYQPQPQPQPGYQQPYQQQPAPYYPPPAPREPLLLTQKGTMQLGGTVQLEYNHVAQKGSDWENGTMIGVAPSFGYFVADDLELMLAIAVARGLGQLYGDETAFGLAIGLKYHIDLGKVFLYLGGAVGMDFLYPDGGDLQKYLTLQVPLGVLIPLNPHLAVDVGMRVNASLYLHDHWVLSLNVPIGYLGVQGYF